MIPSASRHPVNRLSIGQLSVQTGSSISAIRYYESRGLLRSVRSEQNLRCFDPYMARRLALIRLARSAGMSLSEIADIFDQSLGATVPHSGEILNAANAIRSRIAQMQSDLAAAQKVLDNCTSCSHRLAPTCRSCPLSGSIGSTAMEQGHHVPRQTC